MFQVYDKNNKEINCEIIFVFEKDNKNFIVYYDDDDEILASYYKIVGNRAIISPITDDKDFDLVDQEIEKRTTKDE